MSLDLGRLPPASSLEVGRLLSASSLEVGRLLPHAGRMCLIDRVLQHDRQAIACLTSSHVRPDHPLCGPDGLSSLNGVEYGAQAAALHGALLVGATGPTPLKLLAGIRDLVCGVDRLDLLGSPLPVNAVLLSSDGRSLRYAIRIGEHARPALTARLLLVEADAGMPAPT